MPTAEQTKEAIFESMLSDHHGMIMLDISPENLKQSVEFYRNNKKHGVSPEDPAMKRYAQEFADATKGLRIDEFLDYFEKKSAEGVSKRKEIVQE